MFLGVLLLCLAADFLFARHLLPNSDSVQSYREMLSIRSGNILLHGWMLATDNYILTDLVPMLLASFVLGRGTELIYVVPFAVFGCVLATSIQIVRACTRTHKGRVAGGYAVLLLIGVPYHLLYNFFFWSDFHLATVALCLLAILTVAPALSGRELRRAHLLPFMALLFAAAFSDPLAVVLLTAPIVLLVGVRGWLMRMFILDEWMVAGCAVTASAFGVFALQVLLRSGVSFSVRPSASLDFVPNAGAALRDLYAMLGALQVLFAARARLMRTLPLHELIAASRLLTAICLAVLVGSVLWRLPRSRASGVAQLLVAGAGCMSVLATFGSTFAAAIAVGNDFPGAAVRFGVPVFIFLCVAAALELGRLAPSLPARPLVVAAASLAILPALGAATAVDRDLKEPAGIHAGPDAELAAWLLRHHYSYGVGDYWDTQLVEALTGGKVKADPVVNVGGPLQLWAWLTDTSRFNPRNRPQFAIIRPYGLFHVDLASITRTYGTPLSITLVANQFYVARLGDGQHALRAAPGVSPPRAGG